jgi:hypothetical protein
MAHLRAAGVGLVIAPLALVAPLGAMASGVRALPEIPAGVVSDAQAADTADTVITLSDTEFRSIGDVDTGGVLDPLTGQSKVPVYVGVDGERITPERVRRFLERFGSPMAPYARAIVVAGRRWGVDPRLIVAIAGTESTFGRYQLGFNAWGWDAPHGLTRWSSWDESIDAYARAFANGYRSRDPAVIGPRYCDRCPSWPASTRLFFSLV